MEGITLLVQPTDTNLTQKAESASSHHSPTEHSQH